MTTEPVSIVIPTYRREQLLVDTIGHLLALDSPAAEIIVVDQTPRHADPIERALAALESSGAIRRVRLPHPSIPHAMNAGLTGANRDLVLFLDDDVVPEPGLVREHRRTHEREGCAIVAGRVVQPWDDPATPGRRSGPFASTISGPVDEFMGGNFSVDRRIALRLGGFDENFVGAAYRYESEFAFRARESGYGIFFEPGAAVRHLKAPEGGIRSFGDFLTSASPVHCVGSYYFTLRTRSRGGRLRAVAGRLLRSVRTRHHLRRPWWIPVTFAAEVLGFLWAVRLSRRGPALIGRVE